MASAAVVSRGPDILIRTAPSLAATSDGPLGEVQTPPVSASNDPADQDAGVPAEMTLEEKADAAAARSTEAGAEPPDADTKPAKPAAADPDLADLPRDLPKWAVKEITRTRNATRTQIAEASATAKAATEAAEQARAELAALRAEIEAKPSAPKPEPEPAADMRPTREGFDDPDAYDSALTEWATREGERKAEAKLAADAEAARAADAEKAAAATTAANEAEIARINAGWTEKRAKAAEKYADYEAVAEGDHTVSMPMAHTIMLAENGPDIAYHLGQNPAESARIAALPNPALQIFEIGKLAAKLAAPPARGARSRPIQPIDTARSPADTSEREPSMDEWAARRTAEIRDARRPFFSATERAARH